jgi:hypothetical protein
MEFYRSQACALPLSFVAWLHARTMNYLLAPLALPTGKGCGCAARFSAGTNNRERGKDKDGARINYNF